MPKQKTMAHPKEYCDEDQKKSQKFKKVRAEKEAERATLGRTKKIRKIKMKESQRSISLSFFKG